MAFTNPTNEQIKEILEQTKTIAVVGLSDNPERTSHMVTKEMQKLGYKIIPVNPNVESVLGEQSYPSLTAIGQPVDMVNVYRRSEFIMPIAEEAVQIKAKTLWLQQGIINEQAAAYALEHGLQVVMDRCVKVMAALFLR